MRWNGTSSDFTKVEKIRNFPIPKDYKELRSAYDPFLYYQRFSKSFFKRMRPMLSLLKKDVLFFWKEEWHKVFGITDYFALKWLNISKIPTERRVKWILELQQHDFQNLHHPGKAHANADDLQEYMN
jgi:hypothetical protein